MRQEVVDGHLALGVACGVFTCRAGVEDFEPFKGWNKFRHRIVKLKLPFFIEHHEADTGDRLGHGINPKERVGIRCKTAIKRAVSGPMIIYNMSMPHDCNADIRQPTFVQIAVKIGANMRHALGIKPHILRCFARKCRHREPLLDGNENLN